MPPSKSLLQSMWDALVDQVRRILILPMPTATPAPAPAPTPTSAGPAPAVPPAAPPAPALTNPWPPDSTTEPVQPLTPRVLVVTFNPVLDPAANKRLLQAPEAAGWDQVDKLVAGYLAEVEACSGGLVKYTVVEQTTRDYFPKKADGYTYRASTYPQAVRSSQYHTPDLADYDLLAKDLNLLPRIARGDFDEVWFFGGPGFGFYESHMAGPGAFWCNSPAMSQTDASQRRFVIMGFSYERGIGEMLEDLGHRAESVLNYRWRNVPDDQNLWKRFARYDAVAPGQAEVGMMHWAPNSRHDYDWGNHTPVATRCDNWLKFPDLAGGSQTLTCSAWGGGDIRLHHRWWLQHLPKVAGRQQGVANNWWRYVINVADSELDS